MLSALFNMLKLQSKIRQFEQKIKHVSVDRQKY